MEILANRYRLVAEYAYFSCEENYNERNKEKLMVARSKWSAITDASYTTDSGIHYILESHESDPLKPWIVRGEERGGGGEVFYATVVITDLNNVEIDLATRQIIEDLCRKESEDTPVPELLDLYGRWYAIPIDPATQYIAYAGAGGGDH